MRTIMATSVFIALASLGLAQNGTLSGTLSGGDAAKRSTPIIILTDVSSNEVRRVTLMPDGSFSISVPPGSYRVELEESGRRRAASRNLEVVAGSAAQMTLEIALGPASETIEITAKASPAQDDPPEISRSYATRFVRSIPV